MKTIQTNSPKTDYFMIKHTDLKIDIISKFLQERYSCTINDCRVLSIFSLLLAKPDIAYTREDIKLTLQNAYKRVRTIEYSRNWDSKTWVTLLYMILPYIDIKEKDLLQVKEEVYKEWREYITDWRKEYKILKEKYFKVLKELEAYKQGRMKKF